MSSSYLSRQGNGFNFRQGRGRDDPPHRPRAGEDSGDPIEAVSTVGVVREQVHQGEIPDGEQHGTMSVKLSWASYKDSEIKGSVVSSSAMLPLHRRSKVFSFRDAGKARKSKADIPSSSSARTGGKIVLDQPPRRGHLSNSGPEFPLFMQTSNVVVAAAQEHSARNVSARDAPKFDYIDIVGQETIEASRTLSAKHRYSATPKAMRQGGALVKLLAPHRRALKSELRRHFEAAGDPSGKSFAACWDSARDDVREALLTSAWESLRGNALRARQALESMKIFLSVVKPLQDVGVPQLSVLMKGALNSASSDGADESAWMVTMAAGESSVGAVGDAKALALGRDGILLMQEIGLLHLLLECGTLWAQSENGDLETALDLGAGPRPRVATVAQDDDAEKYKLRLAKKSAMLLGMAHSMKVMCEWELGLRSMRS